MRKYFPFFIFIAAFLGLNLVTTLFWHNDAIPQVRIRKEQIEDAYLRPGRAETISGQYNFQTAQIHSFATPNSLPLYTASGVLTSTTNLQNGEFIIGATGAQPVIGKISGAGGITVTNSPGGIRLESSSSITISVQTFTSSSTWSAPSGLVAARVIAVGAGGGGGGADSDATSHSTAGGGGGGGYAEKWFTAAQLGSSQTVTIGAAGSAGAAATGGNGGAGGNTTFGALLTANGGSGGTGSGSAPGSDATNAGGAGGSASSGDINITGQSGGDGNTDSGGTTALIVGGAGGSNPLGFGGAGIHIIVANATKAGNAGVGFGGGGGGAANKADTNGAAGGVGTAGFIMVVEFK